MSLTLLLPKDDGTPVVQDNLEALLQLEEHLLATEIEIPIYFADESEDTTQLLNDLDFSTGGVGQKTSAAQGMYCASTKLLNNSLLLPLLPGFYEYIYIHLELALQC